MYLKQTIAPTSEPITLEEAKAFLRVLDSDSDELINSLIVAAREHVENITNRQLLPATFELYDANIVHKLPKNPIRSIEKIELLGEDGTYSEFDNSLYYLFRELGIGYIGYKTMPSIINHPEAFKITFTSGYDTIPEAIKQYMKVKIATLFENREQFVVGVSISEFSDRFIESLIAPYMVRN